MAKTNLSRPKLLVVGTGFHRYILGQRTSPLACWRTLLEQVATNKKLNVSRVDFSQPTIAWERLVIEYARMDRKGLRNAIDSENDLRKAVIEILSDDLSKLKPCYENSELATRLKRFSGHILNLNFDHCLDQLLGISARGNSIPMRSNLPTPKAGRKKDSDGLYRRWPKQKGHDDSMTTVWHPHGTLLTKDSLRLGLRDYGFQPPLFAGAFDCFKAWEKKIIGGKSSKPARPEDEHLTLLGHAKLLDNQVADPERSRVDRHNNWVTRFMLFDVVFIGAGLSSSEIGLHWLLVQRHRNFARIKDPKKRPKTLHYDINGNSFIPLGLVEREVFESWNEAWESALS